MKDYWNLRVISSENIPRIPVKILQELLSALPIIPTLLDGGETLSSSKRLPIGNMNTPIAPNRSLRSPLDSYFHATFGPTSADQILSSMNSVR